MNGNSIWSNPQSESSGGSVTSVNGKQGDVVINKNDINLLNVTNTSDADKPVSIAQAAADLAVKTEALNAVAACIPSSKIGAANGVPSLDGNSELTATQIPSSIRTGLKPKGVWNAATNTPTLSTTPLENGAFYRVNVAGTSSAPTGSSVTYGVNDWITSNGTVWEVTPNTFNDASISVKGIVRLTNDLAGSASAPTVAKLNGITAPVSAPLATRNFLMSSSTSTMQYDYIGESDLPAASSTVKGIVKLDGDLGGTSVLPLVKKLDGYSIGNTPTLVNQVLAVTDLANKTLGYVTQSGGGGVSANYFKAYNGNTQTATAAGTIVAFPTTEISAGSAISLSSNCFLLKAGYTYKLSGTIGYGVFSSNGGWVRYIWRTGQIGGSGDLLGQEGQADADGNTGIGGPASTCAEVIYTATTDIYVHLEIVACSILVSISGQPNARALIEVMSGAAAITGQSVDYIHAKVGLTYAPAAGTNCIFNTKSAGNITYNTATGIFTLEAGKTYELSATLMIAGTAGWLAFAWYNTTTVAPLPGSSAVALMVSLANTESSQAEAHAIFTPTVSTQVAVRIESTPASGMSIVENRSFATIKQIGTSSVIDMIGATSSAAGVKGTVPAPAAGKQNCFLRGDATWGGVVFQAAEILTGDTWIDGKPIYRKIVSFTNLVYGGDRVLDATLTGTYISTLVKGYGSFRSENVVHLIPIDLAETSYIEIHVSQSGLTIYFTSYFTSTNSGHVVVEYTKT